MKLIYCKPANPLKNPGSGFGKLFNYISGNNNANTKIAMTTPVHIKKSEDENSMSFVLPRKFNPQSAPSPMDESIKVFEKESIPEERSFAG